jgi:hypothetical protein
VQGYSRRGGRASARVILMLMMLAHGASCSMIESTLPCYRDFINRWRRRFVVEGPPDCRLIARLHLWLHFTPTYSSWLNQVELWFAKIERDLLARGIFTSVNDLARKNRRYIRHYNKRHSRSAGAIEIRRIEI